MSLSLYLTFVGASVGLILLPGPNVALILATSISQGIRAGLATVFGAALAMVLQLTVVVLGAGILLEMSARWFEMLRWIGVAYLVMLAFHAWRAQPKAAAPQPVGAGLSVAKGFFVSLTNPKTLLFFGSFLPQFVEPGPGAFGQLVLLAATFVVLSLMLDSVWALAAGRLRALAAMPERRRNRIGAGFFLGAGIGLALARHP
ncbi:LysE family translocator [Methylobacterium komagatae]|uniref:LysE family translocator n=1 Tax=Methylobacterium komagatae TaxID=374425 RepID=A0ABW2BPT7_9HYPH